MRRPRGARLFRLDRYGEKLEESVDDEVRFHLETRIDQLVARGWSRDAATAEVLEQFGDPEQVRERCRRIDERGTRRKALKQRLSDLLSDVQGAFRSLRKSPGYSAVTAFSLAVGIGVSSALSTAMFAVWVAPVPGVKGQDRMLDPVIVQEGADYWGWTYPDYEAVRDATGPFLSTTAWVVADATVGREARSERIRMAYASADYFGVMGAVPPRGRGFLPAEDHGPGQHPVAVVSHGLWQSRFDGTPDILGRVITVNRTPYTVVGVAPEGFRGARVNMWTVDLWVPLVQHPEMSGADSFVDDRERFSVQVLGRLRPGVTRSQAQAALETVFSRLAADHPETNQWRTVRAASFGRFPAQNRIYDLVAVAGLWGLLAILLLIICGNLAGMALARSASREQELAVRLALGSSRFRLVRHLMTEAVLLAVVGGLAGTGLAVAVMATVTPADLGISAPGATFEPSLWAVVLSLLLAMTAAVVFGLFPALRFSRHELVSSLKDDTGGGGRRVGRIQRMAASAQAGAAFMLLVVAALFLRSLDRVDEATLGFEPGGLMVTDFRVEGLSSPRLDLSEYGYPSADAGIPLLDRLLERIGSLPGVAAVAVADGFPLDRSVNYARAVPANAPQAEGPTIAAEVTRVTEGFFEALDAPILQGRSFRRNDDGASEPVAIVSRSLADRLWPGESALNRRFLWPAGSEPGAARTVVGVIGRLASSRSPEDFPQVFLPIRQSYVPDLVVVLRTSGDSPGLPDALRQALQSVDPWIPQPRLVVGQTLVNRSMREQRTSGTLGGGLGLLVLLLSALGVYGVVAQTVAQRTREIGLRMALGADRRQVVRLVLGDAVRLCLPGLIVGGALAAGSGAAIRAMLLGVSPMDPVSFVAAAALLLAVVLLAGLRPALRASGIQPMGALRTQ